MNNPELRSFLKEIETSSVSSVVHHHCSKEYKPSFAELEKPWGPKARSFLEQLKIPRLYSHQAEAINLIRSGEHTLVATPTASGKSLIFTLPVLEEICSQEGGKSLFLYPLKALAQDQLQGLNHFLKLSGLKEKAKAAIYDGDTSTYQRKKLRQSPPDILLTNPEMLHLSILPYHYQWKDFLKNLKFVVIDEVHTYRGVMGSNMAWVFRRLLRLCRYYGAEPVFIFCSATTGNPEELASKLTGLKIQSIVQSGAGQAKKHLLFVDPIQEGAAKCAVSLLRSALPKGLRSIVYSQSRKMTELISIWVKERCKEYSQKISAYRSGFLPEERREIEKGLSSGDLLAVIATNALELGIDIGDLDLCILVGYPGSVAATLQRSGRVGRSGQESAVLLLGHEDSLDRYFMRNPKSFFKQKPEDAVINPYNPVIMRKHLLCAAGDLSLHKKEILLRDPEIRKGVQGLLQENKLLWDEQKCWLLSVQKNQHREVDLRGGGRCLQITNSQDKELLGEIDFYRSMKEAHPGAVYLHRGKTYLIEELDLEQKRVQARPKKINYYTRPRTQKETNIKEVYKERFFEGFKASYGLLQVTEEVTGFEQKRVRDHSLIAVNSLKLPCLEFETQGFWIGFCTSVHQEVLRRHLHFMGGIHALEHAMIGILPLLVLTDRNDLAGISQDMNLQLKQPAVFVYDGIPGGVGFCLQAYARLGELLEKTRDSIASCPCQYGCPSCIHSPKCGAGNRPLDKQAALFLSEFLLKGVSKEKPFSRKEEDKTKKEGKFKEEIPIYKKRGKMDKKKPKDSYPRYGVLDLETQYSAQEVGGWDKAEKMGVSCAVLYVSQENDYRTYLEKDLPELLKDLQALDLVVGFNLLRFDYKVLRGYLDFEFKKLNTLDLLADIYNRMGFRVALDNLAEANLGEAKSANGLQALKWWKEGRIEDIVKYCRKDVEITHRLYQLGKSKGSIYFKNKEKQKVILEVDWG